MIKGFAPIVDESARTLILGSMPSARSLEVEFYYAHPRNQFWYLIGQVLGESYPESHEERKQWLLAHHIALWDVIQYCEREGSLDQNIRCVTPNDIPAFLRAHPSIRCVAFNGTKSKSTFMRYFAFEENMTYLLLPSSSPIPSRAYPNATNKSAAWQRILKPYLMNRD